ncbi:MAG: 50S ribosomal protein L13 [Candidatus Roizmanbacteria bacterium]|nr:50S ribosomal protein L13 [Candidatus Roizmanbacteria bacterium]
MLLTNTKQNQIQRTWHLVDVADKIIGREATGIANLLRGKNKSYFVSHMDCGDFVVVINAQQVKSTGRKEDQKVYTRYSGYPGGLRKETLGELRARKPEDIIRHAVSGMLPKNKLRDQWLSRLFIYADEKHPYSDKISK